MPPRTAIQIADRVVATIPNMSKGSKIDILMLTTLLCFYEQDHERFQEIITGDLKYQDKNGKEIGHEGYIEEHFSACESLIKMKVNPQKIIPTLTPAGHISQTNTYEADTYVFLYNQYLKECFIELFGKQKTDFGVFSKGSRSNKTSPVDQLYKQLISHSDKRPEQLGLLWFQILNLHYQTNSIKAEQYRDYVELASALDLIEEAPKND
jgi:hypothetical protein